jgi:serine/threonine-protein kinase
MGTPFYMSLEQARGAKEVDHRTDIYALGVILYEILSGSKPHPGESYNEILYHVLSQEPAALDSIRSGLPSGLSAVVQKAMAREAADRYASVADLMEALIPFAGRAVTPLRSQVGLSVVQGATIQSPVSLPAMAVSAPTAPPEKPATVPARSRSRVLGWAAAAGVAVLLVALALLLGLHRDPRQQAVAPTPPALSAPAPIPALAPVPAPAPPPVPVPTPAPAAASAAADSHPPATKIESPPGRPGGRPGGQRLSKHTAPTSAPPADGKALPAAVPAAQPAENPENLASPRRKPVRSIDRSNPFAE